MKSKCSFILKSSIALILTALMIFGSVSTVLAATVDMAGTGAGFTIAGDFNGWNTTSNPMTQYGTTDYYYFHLSSSSSGGFKVTDGSWSSSWPTNNWGYDANADYMVIFNSSDKSVTGYKLPVNVTGDLGGTAWDASDSTNDMTPSSDYTTYTKTYDVTADTLYQYQLSYAHDWNWGTKFGSGDNANVTVSSNLTKGTNGGNLTVTPSVTGELTFTFNIVLRTLDLSLTVPSTNYTGITAVAKGTTDGTSYSVDLGSIQSSTTVSSSTGLSVTAPTKTGYTFSKWEASGSGTFDSATSVSTTFYPAANSEVATAQYKKTYTISDGTASGANGSISIDNTGRVAGESFNVTISPNAGYKLATLTVGGADVTSSVSSNSYTGTASGANASISVVATFTLDDSLDLYIAGRFQIWTGTENIKSYDSPSWSDTGDGNIKFAWDATTGKYKVNTGKSLSDLSGQLDSNTQYFFIYDATNTTALHANIANGNIELTDSVTTADLSGTRTEHNVKFNSSSDDYPVTLWFDATTKTLSYTIPNFYDITVNTVTGGSVTASAARTSEGETVTLTIEPDTGYELTGLTTSPSVTLSGEGNTRTFTMPANDVTVTPVFSKITWTGLTAVAKYSTTGADNSYTNALTTSPAVSIADTSATQLDGVTVSAPLNTTVGGVTYHFVGWTATNGSFENETLVETTFKPTAASSQAIAKYKKIFTITSSVDPTGTGAGAAPVISVTSGGVDGQPNQVMAGGSYTITATPASGSVVESVTVNGTAKTATESQTISSVSDDQTVVVKFRSNVYLKGTMNANEWAGDVMTANSDGTSYTIANVELNAGTTYQFRLYADDEWKANSVDTWTLNGIATHDTSDANLTITPSVKAKVTFVSDGTKFTSITAIPYDSTTHNVTLTQSADYTITSTYMGVEYTTSGKNADVTVPVYSGTGFSYTVTPASGKYLSGVAQSNSVALNPSFNATTDYDEYEGTVSSVSSAFTVSATAASKLSIKAVTNKSARGTVSIDKTTAAPGETITITVTPLAGTLKSLTATYGNGKVYEWKSGNNWQESTAGQSASAPASALMNMFANPFKSTELAATGAALDEATVAAMPDLVPVGAASTIEMTLAEPSAVTINATFDNYSGESTWYYNGYDNSGNALSGYHGKQMTESMVSGEKFSYYHVEGRSGADQLMTVSDGVPSSGTRYVYFVRPNNYGDGWSASNNPKAHFWKNGGQNYDTWPGTEMSWQWNNDYGQGVYKIAIPDGADRVSFNDATNNGQHQTVDIDLTTTSGAYYVGEWNSTYSKYDYGTWDTGWADQGWVASGTEYFYQNSTHNGDYTGDFNTNGFYNHNTAEKEFAKPKNLGSYTGNYYINVLYPNTTYTINGVTKTTGTNPMIIWSAEPLAGDDENVTVYAKDGSIRSESYGSTYANIADTKIYLNDTVVGTDHSGNITNQTYQTYKAAKGDTLVIKTQIGATDNGTLDNAADLKAKYYVRGFCVNGEVSELLSWNEDGLYTLTYKIPEDDEDLKKIEITPIYYLKDTVNNPIVTYRVTGFTDALKEVGSGKPNWGDTLYTYPFYGKLGSNNNALGAYPGQPMVYYKGQYQMQIPQQSTAWDIYYDDGALSGYSSNTEKANAVANTNVSGVTMSNGYYDIVHRQIMGYGDNSSSADHVQTYDYGDFYKIFNEKAPVDNIVFDFKYETTTHNFETSDPASPTPASLASTYQNGFELLTNFHGKHVDLFGDPLSGTAADPEQTTPVYVVSIGGVNGSAGVENIAGYYATEWKVFTSSASSPSSSNSYSLMSAGGKSSIPPEVLVLNDDDATSFNTTTYPSADASHSITDWKALYTALEAYRGKPVMITYEAADAQIGSGNYATSGGGGATRNDGRWLYSKTGENITSNIKIQYSDDNGDTYTDLDTTDPQVSGLSAYFTNDGVEGQMTYSTTIDPDKTFDFEAKTTNADYKFVGWYMADGTKITSDNASHTERSGSYTFVAKFMQVTTGQLILSHSADKGTIGSTDYQGEGTAKIGVVVKNGDEVVRTYDLTTSDITLDDKIIKSDNSNYTIEVTLEATATGSDVLGPTVLANPSGEDATFFASSSTTTVDKTKTIVLDSFTVGDLFTNGTNQSVKNIIYHSYFTQAVFHYKLKFEYKDRFGNDKVFYRDGNLTSAQAANTNYVERVENGAYSTRYLRPAFIETIAPHVSNFGEDITWNLQEKTFSFTVNDYYYNCDHYITATTTGNDKRNVTFVLPYQHSNGIATGGNAGTAATTTNFEMTGDNAVTFDTIPVLPNNGENGIYTDDTWKKWIAAPATINDNDTTKYFQYWSVKSTSAGGVNDPEVARCYFQGFNFCALDNYTVTPIYGDNPTDISNSGIYTGVSYLETSRNQWNDNQNRDKTQGAYASDLLFNDFILNYNFKGADIFNDGEDVSDIKELGVVVERIKELDINQDGSKNTNIANYTSVAENLETVTGVINGTTTNAKFIKDTVAKTALDNKNRIKFYEAFYNGKGWSMENQSSDTKYTYKNWVYRAYTYIKYTDEQGNDQIELSVPAYFTMYDEATANYVAPTTTTNGN